MPANRIGHVSSGGPFSAPTLKVIQELISLTAFSIFTTTVLKEKLRWTDAVGFVLIIAGVAVAMAGREVAARRAEHEGASPHTDTTVQLSEGGPRAYEQLVEDTNASHAHG